MSTTEINEKEISTPVLTIHRPQPARQASGNRSFMDTIEDVDSTHSITPTVTRHGEHSNPFYDHNSSPTTLSLDQVKTESKQSHNIYESDLEACLTDSKTNVLTSSRTKNITNDSTVWPCQKALKEQHKAARRQRQRGCNRYSPLRNLEPRTKIWVKILIALLIVGIAVGVGVGISKAVGGGIWHNPNS